MSSENDPKKLIKCPLCEGRGELPETEMFDRLSEKDIGRKLKSYVGDIVEADQSAAGGDEFHHRVDAWNCTHFLWRRSPKE